MKALWVKLVTFLQKYSAWAHTFLISWNLIVTAWATGSSVSTSDLGLPFAYSINVREAVVYIQAHMHIPTWVIGIITFAVNVTLGYVQWKKNHMQVTTTEKEIETPAGIVTEKDVKTTDIQEK